MNVVVQSVVRSRSRNRSVYRISGATATVMTSRYPPFAAPRHHATAFAAMASAAALDQRERGGRIAHTRGRVRRARRSIIDHPGFGPSDPNAAAAAAAAADDT